MGVTAPPFDPLVCLRAQHRHVASLSVETRWTEDALHLTLAGRPVTIPLPVTDFSDRIGPKDWFAGVLRDGAGHEPGLVAWLLALSDALGDTPCSFLDIGALYGLHSFAAAQIFARATCVAIEPHPASADWLAKATRDTSSITVRQALVSDGHGVRRVGFDGFVAVEDSDAEAMPSVALSGLLAGLPDPVIVKIDTEGAQSRFLPPATSTLIARRAVILLECDGPAKLPPGVTNAGLVAPFLEAGYTASWCDHRLRRPAMAIDRLPSRLERNGLVTLLPPIS